jgi:DNA-binding transcriptional ArsR family regulator
MSRAATTSDVFNAVAEPRRREIIRLLANGAPRSVGELVDAMELAQPAVSKHLGVLKAVGLVSVQKDGKNRLYTLNPAELKAVHDWVKPFERFWSHQLDRVKQRAERKAAERAAKN